MTEWLAADTHRWGAEGISKSKRLYLIAQQSSVECSAYFEHVQIRCFVFFVLSFYFQIFFSFFVLVVVVVFAPTSSFFFYSWESVPGTQKKKERKKSNQFKKRGIKKILFNFLILELWYFSPLVFVSFSPVCWCTSARCGCSGGVCAQGLRTRLSSQYAVF